MRRVGPCLLVLLAALLPAGVGAQTGLLLVGGRQAAEAAAVLEWPHGPVASMAVGEGGCRDVVERGMAALVGEGARRLLVVPVLAPGDAACATERNHSGPLPVLVLPGVALGESGGEAGEGRALLARRVLARAEGGLLQLASDALPPGTPVYRLSTLAVTATRTPLELFGTAAPASVVGSGDLHRRGGPLEAVATLPGVEIDGVGAIRRQPVIRGFTGQRVLLLEDGLRLANSRRRLASVEPVALVGAGAVERVEVVRGPASVLYGSDAIGGVVNLVTRGAPTAPSPSLSGAVRARGSSAGDAVGTTLDLDGTVGALGFRATAGARSAGAYRAPAGAFGEVRLPGESEVHGTGVRDRHGRLELALSRSDGSRLFLRGEAYRAEESGFGWIDPGLLGDDPTRVRLTFPDHLYRRGTVGWNGWRPGLPGVETMDLTLYAQANGRDFVTDVLAPLGPRAPEDARLHVTTANHTDLGTLGLRWEVTSRPARDHLLTWGVDAYRDRSRGHDTTTVTITGLGPPNTTVRSDSGIPDATLASVGLFVQDRWAVSGSTDLTAGARWQDVRADPDGGDSHVDRSLVGSLGVVHRLGGGVALVGSVARGFRSPNLVERFFSGATPGGEGLWARNPGLEAESSVGADLGIRLRTGALEGELFVHRTVLHDGIRLEPTGRDVDGVPEYRNENVDELVARGVEAWASWAPLPSLALTLAADLLDRANPADPEDPLAEGVRSRVTGTASLVVVPSRLTVAWETEWRGSHRQALGGDAGPVGPRIPAYDVHDARAVLTLGEGRELAVGVDNVFDRLHARTSNVAFFRPEPGRALVVSLRAAF